MALDQATSALLGQMAELGSKPIHEITPTQAREQSAALSAHQPPGPPMEACEDVEIGPDGARFGVRVLVPRRDPLGVLVYYHGGGWVLGDVEGFDSFGRVLAERTGCAVVLVDYRLAPEHPFPAAADDAYEALLWAERNRERLAGAAAPLILAGDSAGGNLTAVTARRARDAGGPRAALQILVYPVTDCDLDNATYLAPENQLFLERRSMEWFWDHYVPDAARRADPDASPLRAPDLTGLPPAEVLIAEHDVLRAEGEAYAARLEEAGVPVRMRLFEGQMHGFFTMHGLLPGSAAAVDHVADAVAKRLAEVGP